MRGPDDPGRREWDDSCRGAKAATTRTARRVPPPADRASPPSETSWVRRPAVFRRWGCPRVRVTQQLRNVRDPHPASQPVGELDHAGGAAGGHHARPPLGNRLFLPLENFEAPVGGLQEVGAPYPVPPDGGL